MADGGGLPAPADVLPHLQRVAVHSGDSLAELEAAYGTRRDVVSAVTAASAG